MAIASCGCAFKEAVRVLLKAEHSEVLDLGTHSTDRFLSFFKFRTLEG